MLLLICFISQAGDATVQNILPILTQILGHQPVMLLIFHCLQDLISDHYNSEVCCDTPNFDIYR